MQQEQNYRQSGIVSYVLIVLLVLVAVFVWSAVWAHEGPGNLTVSFLDVGQGDATLIETPNGRKLLIDGGKGRAVLRELGSMLSFNDRSIDVVIATHPDLDHIGGLPEVFKRYDVGMYIEPGVKDDGADYAVLVEAVLHEGLNPMYVRTGMQLTLDEGVLLQFLFPDRDTALIEANTGSVIARLVYGDTEFLFTGDSPQAIEKYVVGIHRTGLESDVLKLGHHGSRTSTSDLLLGYVKPEYAVASASCNNTYGHPHTEVLERLKRFEVEVFETCKEGTVTFVSDGVTVNKH